MNWSVARRPWNALRRNGLAITMLSVLLAPCLGRAMGGAHAGPAPSAAELKAAFLYNFGKFVVWPPASLPGQAVFLIGVLGEDPIADALDQTVRDKLLHDRRIILKRFRSARDARDCQILFVSAGERARLAEVLDALEGAGVLTVSDMEGFADRGGMIRLVLERNRYRFEINLLRVERAGLMMSSQLLKLARRVIAPPAKGD